MHTPPIYKDIILIGGGHTHALFLRMWGMKSIPGVRVTLVSHGVLSPYSGMLPGVIAGHYSLEDNHIDLLKLCRFAGARFINAKVTGIDHRAKCVHIQDRPALYFDYASINTGAAPDQSVQGVAEYATPIKPISEFLSHWHQLLQELTTRKRETHIVVVGSGAGGIETLLAMEHALSKKTGLKSTLHFHLVVRGHGLLKGYSRSVKHTVKSRLSKRGIHVHYDFEVAEVQPNQLIAKSGETLHADTLFWCTSAGAADWPKQSGLRTDEHGFITVNPYLQCIDKPNIFAVGDIAHMPHAPRPKAGVYAVRQAPVLFGNLRALLLNKPLKAYKPQDDFLSLVALGNQTAVGSRKPVSFNGAWVWNWKDRIDREFMDKFHKLPPMSAEQRGHDNVPPVLVNGFENSPQNFKMRCGGCGAKVGASVLSRVLADIAPVTQAGVSQAMGDDAAVFALPADQLLVQSVDQLRDFIDDPYTFGRLSALHALSDLFAMNAKPHSAQAIVSMPYGIEAIVERDLEQLMQGAVEELNRHQCALIGGHTSEASDLSLGFTVNGTAQEGQLLKKGGAQAGDVFILTQALGTGLIFAADMRYQADGRNVQNALHAMLQSNQQAATILFEHQASACTDVTGFGLAGHLAEILKASDRCADIQLDQLPVLSGAYDAIERGIRSSLYSSNRKAERVITQNAESSVDLHNNYPLLFDPQTCGGLLASVSAEQADSCLKQLKQSGYHDAIVIGEVVDDEPNKFGECINLL